MKRRTLLQGISAAAFLSPAVWSKGLASPANHSSDANSGQPVDDANGVYELRVYHAVSGRLPDLLARFRDHTTGIFARHGIENVAYWTPMDDPEKDRTLIYILRHPSREQAKANWKAFQDDPEWKSVKEKSEANGPLVEKIDSTYMVLTDFSPRILPKK